MDYRPSIIANGLASYDPEKVEATAAALDLCLACKGCNAECPSGVDIAKLKFEFQSQYYKTHPRQWRDYVFGYFHVTARLGAAAAPLTNTLGEISLIKNFLTRTLGITSHRPFPKFSRKRAQLKAQVTLAGQRVILLTDSFSRYMEPEVEQAAFDILVSCGFDVQPLPVLGVGASFLSKAFLDQARSHAAHLLDLLSEMDPSHNIPVVGIEPPEIYTLKNDYVDLLPQREEEIHQLVRNVWLLEEFLVRSAEFNHLRIVNRERLSQINGFEPIDNIHFHPHCHQRAEGLSPDGLPSGTTATMELLRSCGYEVELMDTGCCGMAGTFGYEAEHYELSMKVAELKLFPQIRELVEPSSIAAGRSTVVSTGAACRMQIKQGTGVDAIHPILLVADKVKKWRAHDQR